MKSRILTIVCLLAACFSTVNTSRAEDRSLQVVADLAIVRPGCFIVTIIGSAVFVVALPFAATSKSIHTTADTLVLHPAAATFTRPIGDFSDLP